MSFLAVLGRALAPVLKSDSQIRLEKHKVMTEEMIRAASPDPMSRSRFDAILEFLMRYAQYKGQLAEMEKKLKLTGNHGSYLALQQVSVAVNHLRRYIDAARDAAAYGEKCDAFTLRTAEMPFELGVSLIPLPELQIAEFVAAIEVNLVTTDGIDEVEMQRMRKAGFKIEIIKNGLPAKSKEFEPTSAMNTVIEQLVKTLDGGKEPVKFPPGYVAKMVKGTFPAEQQRKYPGPAWSAYRAAIDGKGEKVFKVDIKDLPAELQTGILQFEKDPESMLYLVMKTLEQLARKWFEPRDEELRKALTNGWRFTVVNQK